MSENTFAVTTLPTLTNSATEGQSIKLSTLKGKKVILYFYPKDSTPGCTRESIAFRDAYPKLQKLNVEVIGISRDSLKSHEKFKSNHCLPFSLIADTDESLCQLFEVIKLKNRYGKQVRGIERSTFLFDETGKLVKIWRNVKVDGHVEEVLAAVKTL